MPKKRKLSSDVDWSAELLHCMGLAGKFVLKLITWTLNVILTLLLVGGITGIIVGGAFGIYLLTEVDPSVDAIDFLKVEAAMTSRLYYREDPNAEDSEIIELESQRLSGEENRIWAAYDEFPENLINAVVAIEDKRFWTHPGVDFITTVRCTLEYFIGDGTAGASSITQQLIKNITGDDDVTIQRKAQEIMRALSLERTMTKNQILELYLNTVYFGHRSDGVSAAAFTYFGKEVKDLTLVECAAIVGITQNPSKWDPYTHPENNRERRQVVLTAMRDQGLISEEEYLDAWHADIKLAEDDEEEETDSGDGVYSWYTECVIDQAVELLMEQFGYTKEIARTKLYTGGLQIVTAQDITLQEILEDYYENEANFEKVDDSVIQPESSFVLIHPNTGEVLAIVGGRGEKTANRILNYATVTKRPSGSSIKPLTVYAPAIEAGIINYGSVIDDTPVNFTTRASGYPKNSSNTYRGLTTVHYAVSRSVNTIAYKTLMMLGIERSFEFAKEKCHLENLIESQEVNGKTVTDMDYAPLALGQQSFGLTTLEMTAAYSMFANNGIYNHPRFITEIYDSDWNLLIDNKQKSEIAISESTASLMTIMMEEVVNSGTGTKVTLRDKIDVAGKTGTTQSECDRWFIGYTPYYLAGAWFGYSMPQSLDAFNGNPALFAWDGVMTRVHEHIFEQAEESGEELKSFKRASSLKKISYCADSGKVATDACRADPRGGRVESGYFTSKNAPKGKCDVHVMVNYDRKTKAIAHAGCPAENVTKIGLLNIQRFNPRRIKVTDAQYTYWDIEALGLKPGGSENEPFYINAVPSKLYTAVTGSGKQFNHICSEHLYKAPGEETEPPETFDPLDTSPTTGEPDTGVPDTGEPGQETDPPVVNPPEQTDPPVIDPPVTDPPVTSPPVTTPTVVTDPPSPPEPEETDPGASALELQ